MIGNALDELGPAFDWLDRRLKRAVAVARAASGPDAAGDPYREMYISDENAERLLAREPGSVPFDAEGDGDSCLHVLADHSRMATLAHRFGLSELDVGLAVIALAPELDLRYERLYGYLQDDLTRKRPMADLGLNLVCSSPEEKLAGRARLAPDAPLVQSGLLRIVADPGQPFPPVLAHYLILDEQVVRFVFGQDGLDPRLAPFCRLIEPQVKFDQAGLSADAAHALATLASQASVKGQSLHFEFYGPPGAGKSLAAEAVAECVRRPLMIADLTRAAALSDFDARLGLLFVRARLHECVLYLNGLEAVRGDERAAQQRTLADAVAGRPGITIMAGDEPWSSLHATDRAKPLRVIPVHFPTPDAGARRAVWLAELDASGATLEARDIDALADRFRLTAGQITAAVARGHDQARWRCAATVDGLAADSAPSPEELFAAARAQSAQNLGVLARKITPQYTWADIVLPAERLEQLREICNAARYRALVYETWGFDLKLSRGKGLSVLFAGPSGTGKTMAAEIIAAELHLDLYQVDLSAIVSKYIGETEKNLAHIFDGAERSNAILFFDEADALFGRRSEVKDSHDRYANIEISYLLQRMEAYEGVAILATNLRKNMDDAFVRRLQFTVEFPLPAEADRRRIWQRIWPAGVPRDSGIDLEFLARRFELPGGNIRNIAVSAAFLAADDGGIVTMAHLVHATRREFQKTGKVVVDGEFAGTGAETVKTAISAAQP